MSAAYDRLLSELERAGCRVWRRGDTARASCPVHGSRGLTLSVRAEGDRARLHCFAGCSDVDVLDVLGLGVGDLFDAPPAPGYRPPPRPPADPWTEAMRELGIPHPPPIEHVLHRMEVEAVKEAGGYAS